MRQPLVARKSESDDISIARSSRHEEIFAIDLKFAGRFELVFFIFYLPGLEHSSAIDDYSFEFVVYL